MKLSQDKYDFEVHWEPFLLRPQVPVDGEPMDPSSLTPIQKKRMEELSKDIGLNFSECSKVPNTMAAHALLQYAREVDQSKQESLSESLYKTFFADGIFIDTDVLIKLGKDVGFDAKTVKRVITDKKYLESVHERAKDWVRVGVKKIPCFYMNGHRALSGAQDTEIFVKTFDIISQKEPVLGSIDGIINI